MSHPCLDCSAAIPDFAIRCEDCAASAPVELPTRACLGCGALSTSPYCEDCKSPHNFGTRRNPMYDHPLYRRFRARFMKRWIRERGMTCAGWRRPPHPATNLELDHVVALARGGALTDDSNAQALCTSCNRAKSGHAA